MPRLRLPRITALALLTVGVAACDGQNLFSLAATAGSGPPTVVLTTPVEGFNIPVGDSIPIVAEVNSPVGGSAVIYRGTYTADGTPAYIEEPANMNGINVATLRTWLVPVAGQVPGTVSIAVEVSDLAGAIGADSVQVVIIP